MQRPGPPGWELDAKLWILLCKIIIVLKSNVKTGSNLTEFSKEGYGSKTAVLPMMIMQYCGSGGMESQFITSAADGGEW
jgi:hypothetical protein